MSSSKKTSDDGSTKKFVHFHKSLTDAQPHLAELAAFEVISRPDLLLLDTGGYSAIEGGLVYRPRSWVPFGSPPDAACAQSPALGPPAKPAHTAV